MTKNILIGVGNLLFFDDGVGVIAVEYLKRNYMFSNEIELLDGGTLGFNLLEYFLEYENVFIIDTISTGDSAGEIYKIPSEELLGGNVYKNTAHEVEVLSMLEACEFYETKAKVTIFGVVPEDIEEVRIGLSDTLKGSFEELIERVLQEIRSLGIEVSKKESFTLIQTINDLR